VAARCGEHLDLEAALALGDIHLGHEVLGRHLDAEAGERGRECRRSALVILLREEGNLRELDLLGQSLRQRFAQLGGLRPHRRAAGEQASRNKNARDQAGVSAGLAAAEN
jgi:hypothetical protein